MSPETKKIAEQFVKQGVRNSATKISARDIRSAAQKVARALDEIDKAVSRYAPRNANA